METCGDDTKSKKEVNFAGSTHVDNQRPRLLHLAERSMDGQMCCCWIYALFKNNLKDVFQNSQQYAQRHEKISNCMLGRSTLKKEKCTSNSVFCF